MLIEFAYLVVAADIHHLGAERHCQIPELDHTEQSQAGWVALH